MPRRPLTDAAVLKQLKTVGDKLAAKASGEQRLALLRRQADLGDQRDASADTARRDAGRAADSSGPDRS